MSEIPEIGEWLKLWLQLGDQLIAEMHCRDKLMEERITQKSPRDKPSEDAAKKQIRACNGQIETICGHMEGLEEGFGVQFLLKDEVLTTPLRCAVALLAKARLCDSHRRELLGDLTALAGGDCTADADHRCGERGEALVLDDLPGRERRGRESAGHAHSRGTDRADEREEGAALEALAIGGGRHGRNHGAR